MDNRGTMSTTTSGDARVYGYCRISTAKQSIERQRRNIMAAYPSASIIEEVYTGTSLRRPKWDQLHRRILKEAAAGERVTVVFDSVSRMSRNAEDGYALYEELYNANVCLVFLKEPHINTSTYKKSLEIALPQTGTSVDLLLDGVRAYLMELAREQIRLAFEQSEKEVADLHRRTAEGLLTAKLAGKQVGRVAGREYPSKKQRRAVELIRTRHEIYGGSLTDEDCMQLLGVCRNSYYKYKRIAKRA